MTLPLTSLKKPAEVIDAGLVDECDRDAIVQVAERYAIAIPPTITALIDPTDKTDPIARQFVPDPQELDRHPLENDDPIGDAIKSPVTGIVHRYKDRALLKLVTVCPVYCRFCFRREMIGPESTNTERATATAGLTDNQIQKAVEYLRAHKEIWEVIITGGDPLILSPRRVAHVSQTLSKIPHVKIVRWHTRVPVVTPEHITPKLVQALDCPGKAVYIGLHTNHPREMTPQARTACARIIDAGHTMVSQTVLLKGVNDSAVTLEKLMRVLVETRVKPYYLHHTDMAPGTAHFRVSIESGRQILRELRANLSGLAQPTYVLDIPGAHGKVPIGPTYLKTDNGEHSTNDYQVTDPRGDLHHYNDGCTSPANPSESKN